MTWDEAMDAFKRQIPVVMNAPGDRRPILCSRICEVGIRANKAGKFKNIVSAMDKNGNCVYHGTPDMFRLPEGRATK